MFEVVADRRGYPRLRSALWHGDDMNSHLISLPAALLSSALLGWSAQA
jgi:hypothetical protein